MTRDQALKTIVPLSIASAIVSLVFAAIVRFCQPAFLNPYGYIMLGLWAVVPPAWFIYEWTISKTLGSAEQDRIKHFHDLARNLWLALVLALAAIMGAENPFK
jgi:hypothetical protein